MNTHDPVLLPACVVNASVVVKLFVPEQGSATVRVLLRPAGDRDAVTRAAPDLLYLECANVFWKRVRRGLMSASQARTGVTGLLALDLRIWPAEVLVERALELVIDLDVTVYDASYLALADLLAIPLVTADATLVRKAGGPSERLVLLDRLGGPAAGPP